METQINSDLLKRGMGGNSFDGVGIPWSLNYLRGLCYSLDFKGL